MVEDSENIEAENVIDYAKKLSGELPDDIKVEYLHGKMKASQKNEIMEKFSKNEINVLVRAEYTETWTLSCSVNILANAELYLNSSFSFPFDDVIITLLLADSNTKKVFFHKQGCLGLRTKPLFY